MATPPDSSRAAPRAALELTRGARVLLASFIGIACGVSSLYFYTLGIFLKPIAAEYGWSRTALSVGSLISVLTLAAIAPWIGRAADRIRVSWLVVPSMVGLGLGFWTMAYLPRSMGAYLVLNAIISAVAAGTTPIVFTRLLTQWFDRSRGLALGIALAGTGITGATAPALLGGYVALHGWKEGYRALACIALIAALLVGALLHGNSQPNPSRRPTSRLSQPATPAAAVDLHQALRFPAFWLMAAAFFSAAVGIGAVIVHLVPMLTDAGVTGTAAGRIAGLIGLAVIAGRLVSGALLDRISAPRVAVALFLTAAGGCLTLALTGPRYAAWTAASIGFAMGAEVDLVAYLVSRYFGMRAYGIIYGCQYTAFLLGTALGPLAVAAVFDAFGTYAPALSGCAAALVIAALLATRLPATDPRPTRVRQLRASHTPKAHSSAAPPTSPRSGN